jgi:hypothetical protein
MIASEEERYLTKRKRRFLLDLLLFSANQRKINYKARFPADNFFPTDDGNKQSEKFGTTLLSSILF